MLVKIAAGCYRKLLILCLTRQKKSVFFTVNIGTCYINTTFIKSLKGGLPLMKKIFAIFVAMMFVASLSLSVVGCKKAEEPAPAPASASGASGLPGAPGAPGAHGASGLPGAPVAPVATGFPGAPASNAPAKSLP
jgi:hypothetical protein